jgi:TPP-dependent pyruvate/acetoin dehydrogenase alpha subunit
MFDPELYRTKEEVEKWKQRDPILMFKAQLFANGVLDEARLEHLEQQVAAEIADAVAFAEASPLEPVEDLTRFVYSERSPE